MICSLRRFAAVAALMIFAASSLAQPASVEHAPDAGAFGEPSGTTQRTPVQPREDELASLYFRVSFQFTYDRVAVYYTIDGSEPQGGFGVGAGTTQVLTNSAGQVVFRSNENSGDVRDWWRADLPAHARAYNQQIRYKLGAWSTGGGSEAFAGGTGSSTGATAYTFTNKLAWPGAGFGEANPGTGYPSIHFWKEEAVVGNNYINLQLDQNGSYYDIYYPGAGGVYGVGTKNEGYVDGLDTFPAGLALDNRGQMHINQAQPGIRLGNTTYWMSNIGGGGYTELSQQYLTDTNTVATTSRLQQSGQNILVQQYDFAPKGITYPLDGAAGALRGMAIKRLVLTNQAASPVTVNVYFFADAAINGGDNEDTSGFDVTRGAMIHSDTTLRSVTNTGSIGPGQEYNPTADPAYLKNVSVSLAWAMKTAPSLGAPGGDRSTDGWRDTSGDNGIGWIGQKVSLPPGVPVEVDFVTVGGFDNFAGATGTYDFQMAPVIDWFFAGSAQQAQAATDTYWQSWLASGVHVDTPNTQINALFNRSLLAGALHIDGKTGSVIAGFHNGAYPYVWPRDAVYAAVTFARTGHTSEAAGVYDWMKNTAYRQFENWPDGARKGFWKQKYSTDGYVIWGAPQIDETAVFPWGVWFQYQVTGDNSVLTTYLEQVRDAVLSCTRTSLVDSGRLNLTPAYPGAPGGFPGLMYSNNVWEDSYQPFVYSNANIIRGLRDAANIFGALGLPAEAVNATNKANEFKTGLDGRLAWDGENTDISLLGTSYPFEVYAPNDSRVAHVADRINGVATDRFGNNQPLVNFSGEFQNLINRYWGDTYWNGGPWFLSTLWYGCYYAQRQDFTPGKGDIDNHLLRVTRAMQFNGPSGLGAEQMSPSNSLLYTGQNDYRLQAAWPNAWESMTTYADAVMMLAGFTPDAPGATLRVRPKLPTGWPAMTFANLPVGVQRISVAVEESGSTFAHTFQKSTAGACAFDTVVRIPAGDAPCSVIVNGIVVMPASVDTTIGAVRVTGSLSAAVNSQTRVRVRLGSIADIATLGGTLGPDSAVTVDDLIAFLSAFFGNNLALADIAGFGGTLEADGQITVDDLIAYLAQFFSGCP
ncbi:MAG: GC-type dockerin domain-anchored protein [Phycisphaerales bacterium]